MGRKHSIITLPPFLMFVVAFLSMCVLSAVWVSEEFVDLERENTMVRNAYISEQKKILTTIVSEVVSFVEFNRGQTEQRVRRTIRERVEEAHAIAAHLLEKFGPTHSRDELEEMVRESLRPIRFNNGRGYFFAFDLDGIEQLFADRPEMEGRNMLGVLGARGKHVMRDSLDLVREKGEGYYSYHWTRPGEPRDRQFEKISYVKLIEPLGWVVGTGEYVADMEKDIKREVLARLSKMTVLDKEYVFAGQWDGISLAGPAKGKNMIDVTDVNGVKIVQELIKKAKNNGGFVEYVIPKFSQGRSALKISFVAGIPEWQWYVGVGSFVDDIEEQTARNEIEFRDRFFRKLGVALALVLAGALAVFVAARWLSLRTRASFEAFLAFFERGGKDATAINSDQLAFREFATIADAANKMVTLQTRDLRKAKEEADIANKVKSKFLANMSHELRTPLNAIIGFSESMKEKTFGPLGHEKYIEYVNDIYDSGAHLLALINDILDLSKVEAEAIDLNEEPISLSKVSQAAIRLIKPRAKKGQVKIINRVGVDLPLLFADRRIIKQIVVNLLSNAVKFTEPKGEVVLNALVGENKSLSLVVLDSGIGMDEKELEIANLPFGQVDSSLSRTHEGTGLGLPVTRTLVELHDGNMSIESKRGEGTKVTIQFPPERVMLRD
jgi:signal transduction histidine kinase